MFGKNKKDKKRDNTEKNKIREIEISDEEIEEATAVVNPYYAKVSSIYSLLRYILVLVLVLFVSLSLINNSENITYDNLMLLLKDFSYAASNSEKNFETILYSPDTARSYARYRNSLALSSSSGLKIYSSDGRLTFEGSEKYTNPYLETSDRYMLMYDFGGTRYALYNSFSRIFSETLEYEITGAAVSESGMFAVVTKTKEYNSAVMLYTKNCNLKSRYLSDEYVIDVAINDKGTRICIVSVYAEAGSYMTKIMLCKPGDNTALSTLLLSNVFPMKVQFSKNGNLAVLLDEGVYYYDGDGNLISSTATGENLVAADVSHYGTAFALDMGARVSISVVSPKGKFFYTGEIDGRISTLSLREDYLFVLTSDKITRIKLSDSTKVEKSVSGLGKTMLVYGDNDVLICSDSRAEHFDFRDNAKLEKSQ